MFEKMTVEARTVLRYAFGIAREAHLNNVPIEALVLAVVREMAPELAALPNTPLRCTADELIERVRDVCTLEEGDAGKPLRDAQALSPRILALLNHALELSKDWDAMDVSHMLWAVPSAAPDDVVRVLAECGITADTMAELHESGVLEEGESVTRVSPLSEINLKASVGLMRLAFRLLGCPAPEVAVAWTEQSLTVSLGYVEHEQVTPLDLCIPLDALETMSPSRVLSTIRDEFDTLMTGKPLTEAESALLGDRVVGSRIKDAQESRDRAYTERNRLVAALSALPSVKAWLAYHPEEDTTWEDDWRTIVFIEALGMQMTWHVHRTDVALFAHLSRGENTWDGHTTEEKYARLAKLQAHFGAIEKDGTPFVGVEHEMDPDEFIRQGFLQEANRLFFHPRGLALMMLVCPSETRHIGIGAVLQDKTDPLGFTYGTLTVTRAEAQARADRVEAALHDYFRARVNVLGSAIQPLAQIRCTDEDEKS